MDHTTEAPSPGAMDSLSPATDAGPRWPDASEWPTPDAPPLTVARFLLNSIGANVRPTPSAEDTRDYAEWLYREAVRDHRDSNGGVEPSAQVDERLRDDARELAQDARKGPIGTIAKAMNGKTATDADLVRWYGEKGNGGRGKHRGICIILGESSKGLPLAQVDTDPRHGGDISGEWATLPGPAVDTPGGGRHVFTLASPAIKASSGKYALAPGVEVRVSGFAMLPSGSSSPNRQWSSCDAPRPASPAMCRGGTPARPTRERRDPNTPRQPWDLPDAAEASKLGRAAWTLANECGEGERNPGALCIVGLLARPSALPDDAVASALQLLGEWGAGKDWSAQRLREEGNRWHDLLTRGPRDAEFAAEVLATWIDVRDTNARRWSAAKARSVARNLWKTADRREEGNAGAEDMGHAGGIADYAPPPRQVSAPVEQGPLPVTTTTPASLPRPADLPAYNYSAEVMPSAGDKDALEAKRREIFLRSILPTIGDAYPPESSDRDMLKRPIKLEKLYPFYDFWTVEPEIDDQYANVGHGYGRWFSQAIGGLCESDFKALGAAGAKAGKTHFLGQGMEGLALATAARILGVPGYEDAPIVMPVWISEMPKEGELSSRMFARHFGYDARAITDGFGAEDAPGVIFMASQYGNCTTKQIVDHARAIYKAYRWNDKTPIGFANRFIIREVDLSKFPNPKGVGRNMIDVRTGPHLIDYVADSIDIYRRDLARLAGVAEDEVKAVAILDPGQRWTGGEDSAKAALDALLGAVVRRICHRRSGLGAAAFMTSDTTKAAAKDIGVDQFLSESGQRLAADIFAGSQGIMHHADVIALCGQDTGVPFRQTQWARLLQGRNGVGAEVYPFSWETHLGRFRPRKSEPLRTPAHDSGSNRGGGRSFSAPPSGSVGDHSRTRARPPFSKSALRGASDD